MDGEEDEFKAGGEGFLSYVDLEEAREQKKRTKETQNLANSFADTRFFSASNFVEEGVIFWTYL